MTGDQADIQSRIRALLPPWFGGGETPILDALLAGGAKALAWAYAAIQYARTQTRISTASGGWLDIIAWDFFGVGLQRRTGQPDDVFRARILSSLFRPKVTRPALRSALFALTGRYPRIFEPARPADTGGYGVGGGMGYGVRGRYGSLLCPFQVFVVARRPRGTGIPYIAGYGASVGGYGSPSRAAYGAISQVVGEVTDDDIVEAVENIRPAGHVIWLRIVS